MISKVPFNPSVWWLHLSELLLWEGMGVQQALGGNTRCKSNVEIDKSIKDVNIIMKENYGIVNIN